MKTTTSISTDPSPVMDATTTPPKATISNAYHTMMVKSTTIEIIPGIISTDLTTRTTLMDYTIPESIVIITFSEFTTTVIPTFSDYENHLFG
jgi:hypothetical protein